MNDVLDIGSSMPAPRNIGEAVASGNTMVQTGSKYQTALAVQQPRDLHAVIKRVEAEASIVGSRSITSGLSKIRMAQREK